MQHTSVPVPPPADPVCQQCNTLGNEQGCQRLADSTQEVPHLLDWASCKPAWPVPKASAPARALMRPLLRPCAATTSSRSGLSATSFTIAMLS